MAKQPSSQPQPQIKAAIYCRVSTYEQGKGDFSSLDSQEQMLRQFCETKGYEVYQAYRDTVSGTTLEREHLKHLLEDAEAKHFSVVVVTKLDRVSRNVKDFLDLDETLSQFGVDIIVTTQNIDTTTAHGKMMRTILMAFAQFERDMIAERTREKLFTQAQSGYWGGGHAPLGYDAVDKKLVQNPDEAKIVKLMFEQYLKMPSTVKVAKWLNEQGYKTKVRVPRSGKSTGGGEFSNQLVHDMLRNKIYIGQITFKEKSFKGLHDPLVDDALFEKVGKRLDESVVDRFSTYEDTNLLLLGLAKCDLCGGQMTTFFSQKKDTGQRHFYYRCTTATKFGSAKCNSRTLPAIELEDFTARILIHSASDNEFFEAVMTQMKGNAHITLEERMSERSNLVANQSSMKKQLNNLATNLTRMGYGENELAEYKAQGEGLKAQMAVLDGKLQDLDRDIHVLENQQIDKNELKKVFQDFRSIYGEAEPDVKRRLLNVIIEEIRCNVKRGEDTGELIFKLRGDGSVKKEWSKAKEKNEDSSTPSSGGLSPHVPWLREQDSNLQPCG